MRTCTLTNLSAVRYRVAEEMLPSFFPQDLAVKVLLIGKSINYIRRVCQDRDPLTNTASKMRRTEFVRGDLACLKFFGAMCWDLTSTCSYRAGERPSG